LRTGFITAPGHIYPVIDTGQPAADYKSIYPDRTMTLALDGALWVPIEITMLDGKSDFLAGWQRAIEEWKTYEKERAFYRTADAQAIYAPVAIQQTDLGLQYGNADNIAKLFSSDLAAIGAIVVSAYAADAVKSGDKKDFNRLGIIAATMNRFGDSTDAFAKALKLDPKYISALVNLGNVSYLKGDYSKAIDAYKNAIPLLGTPHKGTSAARTAVIVLVNVSRAYQALTRTKESQDTLAQAASIDPEEVKQLAEAPPGPGTGGTRATNSATAAELRFIDEEPQ